MNYPWWLCYTTSKILPEWLQNSLPLTYVSVPEHMAIEFLFKTFQEVGNYLHSFRCFVALNSHTEALVREFSSLTKLSKESEVCWQPFFNLSVSTLVSCISNSILQYLNISQNRSPHSKTRVLHPAKQGFFHHCLQTIHGWWPTSPISLGNNKVIKHFSPGLVSECFTPI